MIITINKVMIADYLDHEIARFFVDVKRGNDIDSPANFKTEWEAQSFINNNGVEKYYGTN